MTQSFEEWIKNNFFVPFDTPSWGQSYKAGQESRQAEIDELQKRIELAIECLSLDKSLPSRHAIDILKGETK